MCSCRRWGLEVERNTVPFILHPPAFFTHFGSRSNRPLDFDFRPPAACIACTLEKGKSDEGNAFEFAQTSMSPLVVFVGNVSIATCCTLVGGNRWDRLASRFQPFSIAYPDTHIFFLSCTKLHQATYRSQT